LRDKAPDRKRNRKMATKITGEVGTVRYGRDGRSKTTELLTDEPNVVLSVFTSHRRGGTYFSSAMGVRNMPDDGPFTVSKSSPMHFKSLGSSDVGARFSAKNLDAVHDDAVARAQFAQETDAFAEVLAAVPGEKD
jgi:hypothetical protein